MRLGSALGGLNLKIHKMARLCSRTKLAGSASLSTFFYYIKLYFLLYKRKGVFIFSDSCPYGLYYYTTFITHTDDNLNQ